MVRSKKKKKVNLKNEKERNHKKTLNTLTTANKNIMQRTAT
jgi:hypothetical protein